MEDILKLTGVLIVLTLVLNYAFSLLGSFINYYKIKSFGNDLEVFSSNMNSLRTVGSYGSWKTSRLTIPEGYSLFFNNASEILEIHGLENFNLSFNSDVVYSLNLSSGVHDIQLHYGFLSFGDLKNETVVFK